MGFSSFFGGFGRRLTLTLWKIEGGLNPGGTVYPCRCGKSRGGLPSLLPAYPAFSLLFCPLSPRPPSPPGKGEIKVIFMQGAAPLASPALDRLRHLQSLPSRCPQGGAAPLAALIRPAPGERTISNAEVPLPRSPLSLAAGSAQGKAFCRFCAKLATLKAHPRLVPAWQAL